MMTLRPNLLFCSIILLFVSLSAFAQADTKLSATWRVQRYDIEIQMPAAAADRKATAKAKLVVKNVSASSASTLTLRLSSSAEVTATLLNGSAVDATKASEKIGGLTLQRIGIRVGSVPAGGTATVEVTYRLEVKENSGVASISPGSSHLLPMSFWYPTPNSWFFPRGADSAPIRLAVKGVGTVTSAGDEVSPGVFDLKLFGQPFFVAGEFEKFTGSGIEVLYPKGSGKRSERAAELAALLNEAVAFAESRLGPRPAVPLRMVAAKRGSGFSSGGTLLIDEGLFRRAKIDSAAALSIADFAAKLWLGGKTLINGDGNGAIREGLTKHIALQFIENKFGADVAEIERERLRSGYVAVVRRDVPITTVAPLDDYYYAVVGNKGSMIWRLLAKRAGEAKLFEAVREHAGDGELTLSELRSSFPDQAEMLDHLFDQTTETNLLAGLPQASGGETRVALRNTGPIDVTVDVAARTTAGETLKAPVTIKGRSFGDVSFKTAAKIDRVEIDADKLYPQTDFSDDVAPREFTDSDLLLAVKRSFDKQEFADAERSARLVLRSRPRYDDVRIFLGRSLLAQNKLDDAKREFEAVLEEKLPTGRSIAWANVGLADIAVRRSDTANALRFAETAIFADAEYGATLAAIGLRNKLTRTPAIDNAVAEYFASFDRTAASNRKAELEALVIPGEASRFVNLVSGQVTTWKTTVKHVDMIDENTALAETEIDIKLLAREPESGKVVYRLVRTSAGWRLFSVDIFEVH